MLIPHRAWPGGGVAASEVVTAGEQFEEKPVVLGDRVGVVEDGGPPVEGVEDDVFAERGQSKRRPVGARVAAEGADVCCRTRSVSNHPSRHTKLRDWEARFSPCKSATLFCVIPPVV